VTFSFERLLRAWTRYRKGKRRVPSVQQFEFNRDEELLRIEREIRAGTWRHSPYRTFVVCDPKPRSITAAAVRDRVVHQVVFEEVERAFEPRFLPNSYSARRHRGVHLALNHVERAATVLRRQGHSVLWAAKGDVVKFYDSVDHRILGALLRRRISDDDLLQMIETIVGSYHSRFGEGKGIPIGNITSQVFANVYLHELDHFAVHRLRASTYFRYADDILVVGPDRGKVKAAASALRLFAAKELQLDLKLRPARKLSAGVDFLGSILWPYGRTLRWQTRRRIITRVKQRGALAEAGLITAVSLRSTRASYRGISMRVRDRSLNGLVTDNPA
jgi:hypothetical protein